MKKELPLVNEGGLGLLDEIGYTEYFKRFDIDVSNSELSKILENDSDVNTVTKKIVTQFLDELIYTFGTPKQIISYKWSRRRKIEHIRTRVNRPQTNGKVERLFGTIDKEIKFCDNDLEWFRMRYNQFRPYLSLKNKTPLDEFYSFQRKLRWWHMSFD